jgi:hypothetical protein
MNGIKSYTCTRTTIVNKIVVAILNSNAHTHVGKEGHYGDYSPCKTFFDHRVAIGLQNAKRCDLKRFQSEKGFHAYVRKIKYSLNMIMNILRFSIYTSMKHSLLSLLERLRSKTFLDTLSDILDKRFYAYL